MLLIANFAGLLPPLWIATFLVYFGIQSYRFRELSEVFGESYDLAHRLGQIKRVLTRLEIYPFTSGGELARICTPLRSGKERPSMILRRIERIASAASIHGNPFLSLVLNILMPWDLFFAYQLEQFKIRLQLVLPGWLEAWYEMEALSSLAEFSYQNPSYTFPTLNKIDAEPVFEAQSLGHPLIPYPTRVTNDFRLEHLGDVILITGSNMSGKSTFLRTVGANLVLAFCGSVTAADRLATLPFRLFASMNVSDSLSDGISYFYAEVRRLRELLEALQDRQAAPLFYLIDEIFRGTNNRERRTGSEAYLHALAGGWGVGLISTHDLELVNLEDEISRLKNYHFREDVEDDRMVFDFRLRPGPSPTTNALRIMALAGLPVSNVSEPK